MDWDLGRLAAAIHPAHLVYHETIGSTNDVALDRCRTRVDDSPFLVLTRHQLRGRGRGSNRWWAAEGALTFSWVPSNASLRGVPDSLLPLAAGLAVTRALEQRHPKSAVGLKWPNDVWMADRKLGGILVEKAASFHPRYVIGVGLNINNSLKDAPGDIQQRATSWIDACGEYLPRVPLVIDILSEWFQVLELLSKDRDRFFDEWRYHCILVGRYVEIDVGKRLLVGQCQGIDPSGALCVATTNGRELVHCGTVVKAEGLLLG